jgi:cytochrome c553
VRVFARVILAGTLVLGPTTASMAQPASAPVDVPAWLFPRTAGAHGAALDSVTLRHVPRSRATFTDARLADVFDVADWHPESHPAMPDIVAHGRKPAVYACAYCHLPDGSGRPENAMLAGLPINYIEQQVADMKSGARRGAWPGPFLAVDLMRKVADNATDSEVAAAARYFSRLRARRRSRVVEATTIPRPVPSVGLYMPSADGTVELLGQRLVEMPDDPSRHERRDPWASYVAYVPLGSIARGRVLSTAGSPPSTPACESCHGPGLRGVGLVPPLAGRSPTYLLRQLLALQTGARSTPAAAPMRSVAETLTLDDMIGAAAYAGSRNP